MDGDGADRLWSIARAEWPAVTWQDVANFCLWKLRTSPQARNRAGLLIASSAAAFRSAAAESTSRGNAGSTAPPPEK